MQKESKLVNFIKASYYSGVSIGQVKARLLKFKNWSASEVDAAVKIAAHELLAMQTRAEKKNFEIKNLGKRANLKNHKSNSVVFQAIFWLSAIAIIFAVLVLAVIFN